MKHPVGQVGALDASGDAGTRTSGPREQLDMRQIDAVCPRRIVAGQQPERAQLVGRDAFRQERLLGDRRVFEHLVEPGDHTRIPGDRRCDSPNVLDQRCAAGIALLLVKPFGERPSALSI